MSVVSVEIKLARKTAVVDVRLDRGPVNGIAQRGQLEIWKRLDCATRLGFRNYLVGKLLAAYVGQSDEFGQPARLAWFHPDAARARKRCRIITAEPDGTAS